MTQQDYYIGLMSGTSMDGTDAVLVDFSSSKPQLLATLHTPHPEPLKKRLEATQSNATIALTELGSLDTAMGEQFALCVNELLTQSDIDAQHIQAIGSHGQTIFHQPHGQEPFTLQIGDPNIIAARTGIATVADFRRRDVALGGQGAPLTPAFHAYLFSEKQASCFVNIGGIANITVLDPKNPTLGYDTGPGNTLLDYWCFTHRGEAFDRDGLWAAEQSVNESLLKDLLNDPYLSDPYPKSTGREYFNPTWLNKRLTHYASEKPGVIQATLTRFTATHIAQALTSHCHKGNTWVAGGGVNNKTLMQELKKQCPSLTIKSTQDIGIDPQCIEAMAFAWFARQTCHRQTSSEPSVTGANKAAVLGGIWQ